MQAWIRRQDPARVGAGLVERFKTAHASAQLVTPEVSAAALTKRLMTNATEETCDVADYQPGSGVSS
jgi:hypothetical protein